MARCTISAGPVRTVWTAAAWGLASCLLWAPSVAHAIEGGLGAYFLGTRDSMAGYVPPPGTYVTNTFYFVHGKAPKLSIAGLAVARPEITLAIDKIDISHFFETTILGATPGLVLTVPYTWGTLEADGAVGKFTGRVRDRNHGFADLAGTALLGWHEGHFHASVGLTVFSTTAAYNTAVVTLGPSPRVQDALNFSKNRVGFLPVVALTWLDPALGLEFSGAVSLEASIKNQATDWQTAPILNIETAVVQHLPKGWALGMAGYYSQQIGEDSGKGPEDFKTLVDARSLQARVFGLGPLVTYQTKVGDTAVNLKLKYTREFAARRRFESNVITAAIGISF